MFYLFGINAALTWIVLLFTLFLAFVLVKKVNEPNRMLAGGLKPGTRAPMFYANNLEGEVFTLSSFADRKTALIFISPNCDTCLKSIPKYNNFYLKSQGNKMDMVLISLGTKDETELLVGQFDLDIPVLFIPNDRKSFTGSYLIIGTPSYCLIDEKGVVEKAGLVNPTDTFWQEILGADEDNEPLPIS